MSRMYVPARAIEVEADGDGCPLAVRWRGAVYQGEGRNHWREHTEWWENEVWRDYYLWESRDLLCEVYRDRLSGEWYLHRVYD